MAAIVYRPQGVSHRCINVMYSLYPEIQYIHPKKYAHGFCFAVLCCGYTLTDFPIPIRLTSLAMWQSNDCPSASKATLMNMDNYFMWIHYERLHNHNKAKHNKTVCIFLGIYCIFGFQLGVVKVQIQRLRFGCNELNDESDENHRMTLAEKAGELLYLLACGSVIQISINLNF